MLQAGDMVLYGAQGICRVEEIVKKRIGREFLEYYSLRPVYQGNSSIFVPVGNKTLTDKMRSLLSKDEIMEIIQSVSADDDMWIDDENERKQRYQEIVENGDRRALIRMIRAFYLHRRELAKHGKRLHIGDDRIFKDAERLLYDEFAFVLQIEPEQVEPFIMRQIQHSGR
jgi:CarD family transcriptional regulator